MKFVSISVRRRHSLCNNTANAYGANFHRASLQFPIKDFSDN